MKKKKKAIPRSLREVSSFSHFGLTSGISTAALIHPAFGAYTPLAFPPPRPPQ